jgi:hypothetical protein
VVQGGPKDLAIYGKQVMRCQLVIGLNQFSAARTQPLHLGQRLDYGSGVKAYL